MTLTVETSQVELTQRERELGAIISAYNEVTERLKVSHERLQKEVAGLREELREKSAELARRERLAALGTMAAGLAHEIRNPLGGIALYASMLQKQSGSVPTARQAAERINQAVRALERLVADILDFAQEYHLQRQWCSLGSILEVVEHNAQTWLAEHRAELRIDEAARSVRVYADPLRLQQVLLNLVMNGLQAAGTGGVVGLRAEPAATGERDGGGPLSRGLEIEIWDNGPGIPEAQLERIFNPFYTTRPTGTGLGLAIVHRIVEAHGGVIRAGNRPEGGARFVVRLPSHDAATTGTDDAKEDGGLVGLTGGSGRPARPEMER